MVCVNIRYDVFRCKFIFMRRLHMNIIRLTKAKRVSAAR